MPLGPIEVRIERSDPRAQGTFRVDREGVHVVLDLVAAAAEQDPTLAYRYSCRSAFCGTCTLLLDGRPVLGCQTPVPSRSRVALAPLGGFPVVRDLVVDPGPFGARWEAVRPSVAAGPAGDAAPRPPVPATPTGPLADSLDCISCGACVAACDLASLDAVFLGPAALTRAMVAVADPRAPGREDRLAVVAGPGGVDACHGVGACSLACPRDLDPQRAIRRLRRWRLAGLP